MERERAREMDALSCSLLGSQIALMGLNVYACTDWSARQSSDLLGIDWRGVRLADVTEPSLKNLVKNDRTKGKMSRPSRFCSFTLELLHRVRRPEQQLIVIGGGFSF
ncbi:hypothetical protein EYF80_063504 [Liparis tanakae]|uniref:Uncharacterized protein n=1 Tax=Liparis tanakae TaxID=230148 RepID=A0A4Z2EC18_9TELE|nr:hypothetical protein EYF80_063504 [Liparis tanakae]